MLFLNSSTHVARRRRRRGALRLGPRGAVPTAAARPAGGHGTNAAGGASGHNLRVVSFANFWVLLGY